MLWEKEFYEKKAVKETGSWKYYFYFKIVKNQGPSGPMNYRIIWCGLTATLCTSLTTEVIVLLLLLLLLLFTATVGTTWVGDVGMTTEGNREPSLSLLFIMWRHDVMWRQMARFSSNLKKCLYNSLTCCIQVWKLFRWDISLFREAVSNCGAPFGKINKNK